jgi:hypothetical protein
MADDDGNMKRDSEEGFGIILIWLQWGSPKLRDGKKHKNLYGSK